MVKTMSNVVQLSITVIALSIAIVFQGGNSLTSSDPVMQGRNLTEVVLAAATDSVSDFVFSVAVPALFKNNVVFEESVKFKKAISAPNIVTSVNDKTGKVTLELTAGSGISVSGMTVTNADTGSSQKIFKTIKIGGTTFEAGSNTDTLELVASGGISLTSDTTNKKVTINSADPDYTLSGFTDAGTSVYLSTTTDNLGLGTTTPSYKLDVTGTGHFSDTLALDANLVANGDITVVGSASNTITFTGTMADGSTLLPSVDLGSDLGSSALRFDNIYVANIYSNDSVDFSGKTVFSYAPTDTTISEAGVLINPTTSTANGQLLGFGIAGYQRALIDAEGDLILGYNNLTSAPVTSYPLTIYGHSGTNVAYIDTSGNLNITGGYSIAGTSVLSATTLGSGILSSSLTAVGALSSGSITTGFGAIDTGADAIVTTGTIGSAGLTAFTGNTLAINSISSTGDISIIATGGNVGIGTATPTQTLTVLGDLASSVAVGVEGLKLTDTTDVTKLAMKWTATGVTLDTKATGAILNITNSTTGLGGLSVESTTTLNSGLASLQALIVKGFSGQTANLQEWQDSTGSVLGSISPTGALTSAGNLDINGTANDIAGALNLSGNSLTSSGALTITPASGSGLNISLATTGDFKVNTNDLVVDTSAGNVGIGTLTPTGKLNIVSTTEQLRLGYDSSNYWSNTVGTTGGLTMQGVGTGGSLTLSPTVGQNLGVNTSAGGLFAVNSNQLTVNSANGYTGIGTATATALLDLAGTSGTDAFRLTNAGTKVLGLSYATNSTMLDAPSTDPTNKLLNPTFDSDLTSWSEVPSYTLNDQFTTDRSAGAVNGTSAEPTGGTRTVVDTNSKLSISSSQLSFATGGVGQGDPRLSYSIITRGAGKTLLGSFIAPTERIEIGWDNTLGGSVLEGIVNVSTDLYARVNGTGIVIGGVVPGTTYQIASVMRSTGTYHFIKGGAFTNWSLIYISGNSSENMYPVVSTGVGTTNIFTADNIRIPTATWLPTPLAYDTFTRGDGTIGSSETTGPDSQTTPSLAWTGGAISSNKNVITPSLGSDVVVNGDFASDTVWVKGAGWTITGGLGVATTTGAYLQQNSIMTTGLWYTTTWDLVSKTAGNGFSTIFGSGSNPGPTRGTPATYNETGRVVGTGNFYIYASGGGVSGTIDNVVVKPLTLSSLFSSVSTSDTDVIADAGVTLTAGTQAGLVTNLDSTSSPANFLIAYHDGTNVKLDKNVGGTYTNLISAAATYSAGATLRVITYTSSGSLKVRVYYNNALVGTEQTVSDAGIISNTKHGLFSTYSGNSFDNFTLWARGTGAEYTSAPFEELTATRDTTTKYNNSTASVQLVTTGTDANYLQSVNVGDTSTYNLIAYAYTTGAAVTTADLNLYYDTAELTTTFTPMGGTGWYKLTGSFTGVASAKDYGVRVKAGKTVYVDEMHLQVGTGTTQNMYVLNSNTGVTGLNVQGLVNGTLNGVATYSKAGTISDSDFSGGVSDGLMGIDTTNHRLYFREGASWSYIARTGGFQIPTEEASQLTVGDLLIPYVESRMSDGAIHGLYKKLSDVVFDGLTVTGDSTLGDAIVTGSLLVTDISSPLTLKLQDLALSGIEFVGGKIKFTKEGLIYGNDLIRGKTTIPAETAEVNVTMNWEESPKTVTLTPETNNTIWVTNISKNGFTIHISQPQETEAGVFWQAIW